MQAARLPIDAATEGPSCLSDKPSDRNLHRNILGYMGASSVRIGTLWVGERNIEKSLARFAKLIFCHNLLNEYPYTLRGTATAVRLKGRCALFCCKHQIKDYSPEHVTIPVDAEGKSLISGSAMLSSNIEAHNEGEEFHDIAALEYRMKNYNAPNLEFAFFDLVVDDCWSGDKDSKFIIFGYPTALWSVDYEAPKIDVKEIVTTANYEGASSAKGVHRLTMQRSESLPSDGLSGAPVFHLGKNANDFYVGWAGTVIRGSDTSDIVHFIEARVLLRFLTETPRASGS